MEYDKPNTISQMVSEPAVATRTGRYTRLSSMPTSSESNPYDTDDAPCQYTIEEMKVALDKNRKDYRMGKYHTMEEVNRIMDSWC